MENYKSLNCGDMNLAAALMSMGIPLHPHKPCSIIKRDNGKDYARFHVLTESIDMEYQTEYLASMWKARGMNAKSECNYPDFSLIMDFVTFGRSQGCKTTDDWFNAAHIFVNDRIGPSDFYPSRLDLVENYVNKLPKALESYVFAFVCNKLRCYKDAKDAKDVKVMASFGDSHVMIDSRLPKWKREELFHRAKYS